MLIPSPSGKSPPPSRLPPAKVNFIHINKQFSHYNPIKSSLLAVVIAPVPFLCHIIPCSLYTQAMLILILGHSYEMSTCKGPKKISNYAQKSAYIGRVLKTTSDKDLSKF